MKILESGLVIQSDKGCQAKNLMGQKITIVVALLFVGIYGNSCNTPKLAYFC